MNKSNNIHAISHRELEITNKLTWKVKITFNDKMILDTHIFELA
jgi:hypothetical protein